VKILTAASAMQALGPNFRMSTKVVYSPSNPDTVVLVGGGDPTLRRTGSASSVYKGAAKMSDLAKQVQDWALANNITAINHLVLDASLITGSTWDSSWPTYERTAGFQPLITGLMVDGDRSNPAAAKSPRSTDPVGRAGREFKKALGDLAVNADITTGIATSGATKIAEVKSAKLPTLISYMISASDNTLAEFLARHVAISQGLPANLESIQGGFQKALATMGLDWSGVVIKDGSGESKFDVVTPALFNDLMAKVLAGDANLKSIVKGFPVAGKSGTLVGRFTGANAEARGHVFAKTGSIFHAYALVGYMNAKDGSKLAFSFFGSGPATSVATRTSLDTVTAAVYACGVQLSNK
jgi:D-alanyl-D-alanine carboxypeptidase/D-alanyl-D-alanine-endopeptidase (penicillin-binding protein 4)